MQKKSLRYQDAGVNIDEADNLVKHIQKIAKPSQRDGVLTGIGHFGALFELPTDRFEQPVLVSSTDGVGTKLKLALALNKHDTIGIDLVAMCVNDILCLGAEPLFFLDYFATGQLNQLQAQAILTGIGKGCELAQTALIGGETAEMPGMYQGDDYDLAGFCVGVVEKNRIIKAESVEIGDILIGIASSGPHANGYSLIRKVIEYTHTPLTQSLANGQLGDILLTPTKIYVPALLSLFKQIEVHACAHITGGGLLENIPRVLPKNTEAVIDSKSWQWPEIFHWLQNQGNIATQEMVRTFNVGVGMVLAISAKDVTTTLEILTNANEQAWVIGEIRASSTAQPKVTI